MDPAWLDALRRQSGIELTRDGVFTLHGAPLENPRVAALFHRGVAVREDGEVTLTVGKLWCYLRCEGVARFVEAIRFGTSSAVARLSGGDEVDASVTTVGYGPDHRFYMWLPASRGPALLLRGAHQALLPLVVDDLSFPLAGRRAEVIELGDVPGTAATSPAP